MVVIDISTFKDPKPTQRYSGFDVLDQPQDTPEGYESRCIVFDAQRAAMMQEAREKACFWEKDSPQYVLWHMIYSKTQRIIADMEEIGK